MIRLLLMTGRRGKKRRGRHGVIPAGRPWIAAKKAPQSQTAAAQDAVGEHGVNGVLGTGGREAAGWRQDGRDRPLVQTYRKNGHAPQKRGHHAGAPTGRNALPHVLPPGAGSIPALCADIVSPCRDKATLRTSSIRGRSSRLAKSSVTRSGLSWRLGTTTKSVAGGNSAWCNRKNSRSTRFTRFRRTAQPTFLVTAMPTRQSASAGVRNRTNTMKCLEKKRRPAS